MDIVGRTEGETGPGRIDLAAAPVLLFDFDGTVADTTGCVIKTVERVLAARGFTRDEMGDLRRFVGPPLVEAFKSCYGFSAEEAEVVTAEYRAAFDEMGPADYPVYPGLHDLLDRLAASGRTLAVATSRLESRARDMVAELGLDCFEVLLGLNREAGRLTKVDAIRDALRELDAAPADAVMVGDSHFDMEGARELGIASVGVVYGGTSAASELERAGARVVCPTVADLARVLGVS